MNGNGKIELSGKAAEIFPQLLNPEVLQNCIMGCKSLEIMEENKYKADLQIGIAAVKGKYDAIITLEDVEAPKHYKLVVRGEGGPGFVEAEGIIDLTEMNENSTLLEYSYEAAIGGKVAAIGQRMLGGVAKLVINDFFKKIKKELVKYQEKSA